jgi:hypothetical protein
LIGGFWVCADCQRGRKILESLGELFSDWYKGVSCGLPTWLGRFERSFSLSGVGFHADCQRGQADPSLLDMEGGGRSFWFWRSVVTTSFFYILLQLTTLPFFFF